MIILEVSILNRRTKRINCEISNRLGFGWVWIRLELSWNKETMIY